MENSNNGIGLIFGKFFQFLCRNYDTFFTLELFIKGSDVDGQMITKHYQNNNKTSPI